MAVAEKRVALLIETGSSPDVDEGYSRKTPSTMAGAMMSLTFPNLKEKGQG